MQMRPQRSAVPRNPQAPSLPLPNPGSELPNPGSESPPLTTNPVDVNRSEYSQPPQPSDPVWTVVKAGETVCQTGELPKALQHALRTT